MKPSFEAAGLWSDDLLTTRHAWFFAVLELLVPRAKRLPDFVSQGAFFFHEDVDVRRCCRREASAGRGHGRASPALADALAALPEFDAVSTEAALRSVAEARGLKAGTLIHAVRVAVTGTTVSPGLFEVVALVGRARVLERLVSYTYSFPPDGRSSNGRTHASGACYRGSNPCLPATSLAFARSWLLGPSSCADRLALLVALKRRIPALPAS